MVHAAENICGIPRQSRRAENGSAMSSGNCLAASFALQPCKVMKICCKQPGGCGGEISRMFEDARTAPTLLVICVFVGQV